MSNGHAIVPIGDPEHGESVREYVEALMIYFPDTLPKGRFPTLAELRHVIVESEYELEESGDWFVTSKDDYTVIWFTDNGLGLEDRPTGFWFRRGGMIVLDIMQKLANQCGSFFVADHSGTVAVLIVPDSVFGVTNQSQNGFIPVMEHRLPAMIERLKNAPLDDALFLLSQIRQTLSSLYEAWRYEFYQIAHQGLSVYASYLRHDDARIRFLAFDLIARLRQQYHQYGVSLADAIKQETNAETKTRMIWSMEYHVADRDELRMGREKQALLDVLLALNEAPSQAPMVRLAAAHMLARSKLGFLTSTIREMFVDALVQPEHYQSSQKSVSSVSHDTLEAIQKLMFHHRLAILLEALSRITYANDAHDVLRVLLNNVFYGDNRESWRSFPLDTHDAERPEVGETQFRGEFSRNVLYPVNPVKITVSELLPFQREILEKVMDIDLPWMVHSNILEKYGLPATRAAVRVMLENVHK